MKARALLIAFLLPCAALADSPKLDIPNFQHLRSLAVDSTDITIGRPLIKFAAQFADSSDDDAVKALAGIDSVRIYNFEFDRDNVYSPKDIEAVRKQLSAPGWSAIAQIHDREPREDVDVFMSIDAGAPTGLAIVASDARSFTIVHVTGRIEPQTLGQLEKSFGLPKTQKD